MASDACGQRRRAVQRLPSLPFFLAGRGRAILVLSVIVSAFFSPRVTEGKDASTIGAGFQHSCVVTGDAAVKVRNVCGFVCWSLL